MSSIAGSRIIVTGGASGMGAAIVRAFAADGVRVASLDINIEQGRAVVAAANDGANGEAAFFACDVADKPNVELAMGEARDWLGGLETVIHAAGVAPGAPAESITLDAWDTVMAVNARSTFLVNQAAFGFLRETGGRILNFASGAGVSGLVNKAHYSASKGAVIAWTRTVAKEWGQYGITVNAIAPAINTPMYARTRSLMTQAQRDALDARLKTDMPIDGALGEADRDLFPVMRFLSSDDARFMTGQIFAVDGGLLMVR